jgi:CMP/dCMP kinase
MRGSFEHVNEGCGKGVTDMEQTPHSHRRMVIAIDGPSAAGKTTLAKSVAKKLGYIHLDTGAMYRAVGWKVMKEGVRFSDTARVIEIARNTKVRLIHHEEGENRVLADGEDVTGDIRAAQAGEWASRVSAITGVRRAMVALQRQMGAEGGVVAEGRDIQTVVFPHADVKVFLTASVDERAKRRFLELEKKGTTTDLEEIRREIETRDHRDSTREDSPLKAAPDAYHLNTDGKSAEMVLEEVLALVRKTDELRKME